jgi:hypothetical protein
MGSLSLIEPSEISLTLEVGQLQTQLKGKVCSLSALEANSFLKALSSPFESTKALLKHFLFEMITSETFDTATYNGLSTQVQELIISFCNTQLRGVRMPLSKHINKQHVPLEDLFPASTTLSAQEYSSKKQLKLSVLLGCYLEGLKQQLAKTGKSADQEAAIQSLYSALYEGSNLSQTKHLCEPGEFQNVCRQTTRQKSFKRRNRESQRDTKTKTAFKAKETSTKTSKARISKRHLEYAEFSD